MRLLSAQLFDGSPYTCGAAPTAASNWSAESGLASQLHRQQSGNQRSRLEAPLDEPRVDPSGAAETSCRAVKMSGKKARLREVLASKSRGSRRGERRAVDGRELVNCLHQYPATLTAVPQYRGWPKRIVDRSGSGGDHGRTVLSAPSKERDRYAATVGQGEKSDVRGEVIERAGLVPDMGVAGQQPSCGFCRSRSDASCRGALRDSAALTLCRLRRGGATRA